MTLLKDLIHIPDQVHKGDFVLKLAEGVQHPTETLRDYVITDQIRTAFDHALGLIKSAVEGNESKAAFLHGSFGSGKSHFLAVLHLLLAHVPEARGHHDLAPVVQKHSWLQGKKFLLVPFHMIGKSSLEQAVFDQYLSTIRKLHPEATVPAVFRGELVFEQADLLRDKLGDDAFYRHLGSTGGGLRKAVPWNPGRYAAAKAGAPNDPERQALISAIVTHLLPTYATVISADGREGFVPIDEGLAILSQHSKQLGYDAILLFLDEVILWLASMVSDPAFVNREGAKLSKLIEFQNPRALPIVSLLARQRDLRELVGEHVPGAEQLSFLDTLRYWEGRFSTVKLEDRNLPVIVERRLLRPQGEAARQQIDAAFGDTRRLRQEIQDVLRTSSYDEGAFRQVYPFSPALVQALVAVSAVLQRERTAIRVLMQLLVDQRETLVLGQIVPVGDLFDAIADGDEPFNEGMRVLFDSCRRTYRQKLRPRLCQDHGLAWDAMEALPKSDPRRQAFGRDDRLVKTLMLAALAPEVEALKSMTALRLQALNHGTFRSPIPGQETSTILSKVRNWAADVSEIQLEGDPRNPTITLRITGVDTALILEKAGTSDNQGNRKNKVRELLFRRLGIELEDTLEIVHEHVWRGTTRRLDVVYGNVRDMPAASLRSKGDNWKLCIDFPFDEEGHDPSEDLQRVEDFRSRDGSSRTVCWLPGFLSRDRQRDLGILLRIDYALANEARFFDLASHLPPNERNQARAALDSQRSMLRQRVELALEAAYGLGKEEPGMLGATLPIEQRFQCLDSASGQLKRPAATLGTALEELCDQMLQMQYPGHPKFGVEIKPGVLKRALEWIQRAARSDSGIPRVVVDRERRAELRAVVEPLGLGAVHEDALVLKQEWCDHFLRCAAQGGDATMTVGRMREWTDRPEPRGLPADIQDLLILTHAEMNNLRFFLHGGPVQPSLERRLDDALELKPQPLPAKAHFEAARLRAESGFGVPVPNIHGAASVSALLDGVRSEATKCLGPARSLVSELLRVHQELQSDGADAPRTRMAKAVVAVLESLETPEPVLFIERLADAKLPGSWEAFGASMKRAETVVRALRDTRWRTMQSALAIAARTPQSDLRQRILEALRADELAIELPTRLRALEAEAEQLVEASIAGQKGASKPTQPAGHQPAAGLPPGSPLPPPTAAPMPGFVRIDAGQRVCGDVASLQDLQRELSRHLAKPGARLVVSWQVEAPNA
jgi:hypothetical protein